MNKEEQKRIIKARIEKCPKCGKKLIPAKDSVRDDTGKWDGHSFKFPCKCGNPNIRVSIG